MTTFFFVNYQQSHRIIFQIIVHANLISLHFTLLNFQYQFSEQTTNWIFLAFFFSQSYAIFLNVNRLRKSDMKRGCVHILRQTTDCTCYLLFQRFNINYLQIFKCNGMQHS